MEKFKKMEKLFLKGKEISMEDYIKAVHPEASTVEVFKNDKYQVIKSVHKNEQKDVPNIVWLSIKNIDKSAVHDWRDFQEIKNELVGRDCEGIELYPAESRKVDTSNQYHLWCFDDPNFRLPFGFKTGMIKNKDEAAEFGAQQRPFEN